MQRKNGITLNSFYLSICYIINKAVYGCLEAYQQSVDTMLITEVVKSFHTLIHRLSTSTGQDSQQIAVILFYAHLTHLKILNFATGMQHGGVIAPAKGIANFRQAVIG